MDETCAGIRPLLAEFALGAASGHERALVVRHVAFCAACSRELDQLSTVADGILLLAPPAEPPAGFEAAVLARMTSAAAPAPAASAARRPRRALVLVAAVLAAVLTGGVGGVAVTRAQGAEDRTLAADYRNVLEVAGGKYLRALRLTAPSGARAGTVFLYEGSPSWVLVAIAGAPQNGTYHMTVRYVGGGTRQAGTCDVTSGTATAAYRLSTPVADVAGITLSGPNGVRLTAD
jgi:hypothetical protein